MDSIGFLFVCLFFPIKNLIKSLAIGQRDGGFEVIGNGNIFF